MTVNFSTWQFLRCLLIFGEIPNFPIFTKIPICRALISNYFILYINYRSKKYPCQRMTNILRKCLSKIFYTQEIILELVNRIYKNNKQIPRRATIEFFGFNWYIVLLHHQGALDIKHSDIYSLLLKALRSFCVQCFEGEDSGN